MTANNDKPAPAFALPCDDGQTARLQDYRGQKLILYFYPKDDTPGCTTQAIDFSTRLDDFTKHNIAILGVSADSPLRHEKFRKKHQLAVRLASDESHKTLKDYGVWVEKNMYGRRYMGIERTTCLIDEKGIIRQIWRKVKVKGHVDIVFEAACALS